jgi:hypothetical protein
MLSDCLWIDWLRNWGGFARTRKPVFYNLETSDPLLFCYWLM